LRRPNVTGQIGLTKALPPGPIDHQGTTCTPTLSYRAEGRQLVADDDEPQVVERIRVLRAGGRPLREIDDILTVERFKSKRSTRSHVGSLRLIVNRLELPAE
jgi:hypothetical protein